MTDLEEWSDEVATRVRPASPDWKAVVNIALDEAVAIIHLIRTEREKEKNSETIGMALLERAELYRLALQRTIDEGGL